VGGTDLRQRVGAPDFDGVRVAALRPQASPLVSADPELLGEVLGKVVRTFFVAGVHDVPA
jgi:hypothetical protein